MSDPHSFKRKKHRRGKRGGKRHRQAQAATLPLPAPPTVILSLRQRLARIAQQRALPHQKSA